MPYGQSGDVRIDCHADGSESPLVLQHGFSANLVNCYELGDV